MTSQLSQKKKHFSKIIFSLVLVISVPEVIEVTKQVQFSFWTSCFGVAYDCSPPIVVNDITLKTATWLDENKKEERLCVVRT